MSTTPEGSVYKRCSCKDGNGKPLGGKCPKLRRTGGAWHPTHGRWAYQIELPVRPGQQRRPFRRGGFDGRDDANALCEQVKKLLDLAGGDRDRAYEISDLIWATGRGQALPDPATITARLHAGVPASVVKTTAEYLTAWIDRRAGLSDDDSGLSPNTIRSYRDHIVNYLNPRLGTIPIQDLRDEHITTMFIDLKERNAEILAAKASPIAAVRDTVKGVRPLGPASMQRLLATLRKALNDCMRKDRLIAFNPALSVDLDSGRPPKPKVWTPKAVKRWRATGERPGPVMVWAPEHAGAFLDYAETHDVVLYPLFKLMLDRGLRRGETVGLRDFDVELDDAHLTVAQQIASIGYRPVTKRVKSGAGERSMPLGPSTVTDLREYVDRRDRWQQVSGKDWPDTGLFFVRPDGQPWHPETISNRFDTLVAKAALPPIRLHDLRHCCATYLYASGADLKKVQELLGHATLAMTSDIYTSVLLEFNRAYADSVGDMVPRTNRAA
ncbi:tyrosine-type recombinase/integrase [Dactylosporangium sp. NPDC051485]|uniref:tyrosine-type recombinase/integrase n=1 Tax=Dactylosporangium sp. NPDC051485 TaxID=3154846 RepID=UPI003424F8B5